MNLKPVKFTKMEEAHPEHNSIVIIKLKEDPRYSCFCLTKSGYFVPYDKPDVKLDFKLVKYWKLLTLNINLDEYNKQDQQKTETRKENARRKNSFDFKTKWDKVSQYICTKLLHKKQLPYRAIRKWILAFTR